LTFNRPASWCAAFLSAVIGVVIVTATVNYLVDFYGLFHHRDHAPVKLYSNERMGKYLLAMHYIPDHFGGLLVGSSISDNWPLHQVGAVRVYNASLSGGNVSEEKLIAENVFASGHMALVVFCIHPYLTANHGPKTSYMTSQDYWAALGSVPLFREYAGSLLAHAGRGSVLVDEYGISSAQPEAEAQAARERRLAAQKAGSVRGIEIDPTAFAEYEALLKAARAQGARVVGFVPPLYAPAYAGQIEAFRTYVSQMAKLFMPTEPIIDFNAPAYAAYADDRSLFQDGVHLTPRAAAFFSRQLALAIEKANNSQPELAQPPT
jgi:hypothetical protein